MTSFSPKGPIFGERSAGKRRFDTADYSAASSDITVDLGRYLDNIDAVKGCRVRHADRVCGVHNLEYQDAGGKSLSEMMRGRSLPT
jgi:hypothetical protein